MTAILTALCTLPGLILVAVTVTLFAVCWGRFRAYRAAGTLQRRIKELEALLNAQTHAHVRQQASAEESMRRLEAQHQRLQLEHERLLHKHGPQNLRDLRLYQTAERLLMERTPHLYPLWQQAIQDAAQDLTAAALEQRPSRLLIRSLGLLLRPFTREATPKLIELASAQPTACSAK